MGRLRRICKRLIKGLTQDEEREEDNDVVRVRRGGEIGRYISRNVKRRGGGEVTYTSSAKPVEIGTK